MIKIQYFHNKECMVYLEVLPVRPTHIVEKKLGKIIADKKSDYYMDDDGKIWREVRCVLLTYSISDLKEMQEEVQEEFSKKIASLKKKLDEFKFLKEITEEPEDLK